MCEQRLAQAQLEIATRTGCPVLFTRPPCDKKMDSDWHSIRPWSRRLALSVREITSVSATFILSSTLNSRNDTEPSLASLGLNLSDDEDGDIPQRNRVVADTLAKGLAVKVNNSPWQRVLLRVDDEVDEALIIVFGLIPGRQYDIELGITPREESLRSQITTDQGWHFYFPITRYKLIHTSLKLRITQIPQWKEKDSLSLIRTICNHHYLQTLHLLRPL
jgi:hypothetical protein